MPTEAVLHRLSSRKMTESLMMQIILHCAPVLKNVKMSSMFTVPAAYLKFVRSVFAAITAIKVRCFCQGIGRAVVYVYREREVQQCLADPQVIAFLHTYGYESTDVDVCLNYLSQRVSLSAQGAESYPHEMGVWISAGRCQRFLLFMKEKTAATPDTGKYMAMSSRRNRLFRFTIMQKSVPL